MNVWKITVSLILAHGFEQIAISHLISDISGHNMHLFGDRVNLKPWAK